MAALKRKESAGTAGRRLIGIQDLCAYLGTGRNKAMAIGLEAGAYCRLGGRVLYDLRSIDAYIDAKKAAGVAE